MPILDLQLRMRQLGEIRTGHVVPTSSGKTRPEKLSKFRFTSPSSDILTGIARAYGGEVKPWTPANGGPEEYEVYTEVSRLPVVIPPTAVTQWYELYQGSRCVRRCDGKVEQKSDRPCVCDPERRDCAITTRLNVMLRDVPPIGYWLLTSRGYYAAVELPPVAELLAKGGGNVPGFLGLEERREVREKEGGGTETRRFMVPTLDVDLSPAQVLSGTTPPAAVAGSQSSPAIESSSPALPASSSPAADQPPSTEDVDPYAEYHQLLREAATSEQALAVYKLANDRGVFEGASKDHPLYRAIGDRGRELKAGAAPAGQPVDADVVDVEPDADQVWQQIIVRGGELDMGLSEIQADFAKLNAGEHPGGASGAELAAYLEVLKQRDAA